MAELDNAIVSVLSGRHVSPPPAAQVYGYLGPLESYAMELRWRAWDSRLAAAGTSALPVEYGDYLDVETEVWRTILDGPVALPTWIAMRTNSVRDGVAGAAVVRRDQDLYWVDCDGDAHWMAPDLASSEAEHAAGKRLRFGHAWTGRSIEDTEPAPTALHVLDSIPEPLPEQARLAAESDRYEVMRRLKSHYGEQLAVYAVTGTPYNSMAASYGFEGFMTAMVERPSAVHRQLEARLPCPSARREAELLVGDPIMFVEECLASADLISPAMYREFSFPYTKLLLEHYEAMGFRTVLYFSGNLMPLLEDLAELPFSALSFEEDRKGYGIDLAEVRSVLGPERTIFGNVDASFIETASDEALKAEVVRQVEVGGAGGRFLLSAGSPLTPRTSLARIHFFLSSTRDL